MVNSEPYQCSLYSHLITPPTISGLWNLTFLYRLRDELRTLSCTYKCRHDAAADLIHMYAYTKCFFRARVSESLLPIGKILVVILLPIL